MVSRRKRLANRRNARKSTGPRSRRGKAIVARNAITHGLFSAKCLVLPGENLLACNALADAIERDLQPAGVLQRELVAHITQLCWKLRRIPVIEAALMECTIRKLARDHELAQWSRKIDPDEEFVSPTVAQALAAQFSSTEMRGFERLEMYRLRLERALHAAQRQLRRARKETAGEEIVQPPADADATQFATLMLPSDAPSSGDAEEDEEDEQEEEEQVESSVGQNKATAEGDDPKPLKADELAEADLCHSERTREESL